MRTLNSTKPVNVVDQYKRSIYILFFVLKRQEQKGVCTGRKAQNSMRSKANLMSKTGFKIMDLNCTRVMPATAPQYNPFKPNLRSCEGVNSEIALKRNCSLLT